MSMTDTAANIQMCNEALGLLGAKTITLTETTEQNYIYCATFFDASRDEILSIHKWNNAKKRGFAVETTKPIFGPDNAYTYPTDCIKVWMVEEDPLAKFEIEANVAGDGKVIITDEGSTPQAYDDDGVDYVAGEYVSSDISGSDLSYLVDTGFTSSDETTDIATYCTSAGGDYSILAIEYVYQRADVDNWPEYMRQCAVYNLALKIAPAIKQDEKAALNLQAMLYGSRKVTGYLDTAKSTDAQEQGGVTITTRRFLDSRW